MPVELIISPPASGKTTFCIQRIRALLHEQPFTPIRVVLPDRLQTAAFRRRLAEAGGTIGVQVGTFGDLYRDLLHLAGRPIPVAPPTMIHRLVRAAIDQVHAAGEMPYYAELRALPGFTLVLQEAFAELKRALVYPEIFIETVSDSSPARQELARLYLAYQTQLQSLQWADPEGLSWLAVEALQTDPNLPIDLSLLIVDGFDSFTVAQRRALGLLTPCIPNILITLPGELPFHRTVQRRFEAAYRDLIVDLQVTAFTPSARSFLPAPLQQLAASLFETQPQLIEPAENLTLIEARFPVDEAREALRWLKAHIVRGKTPIQACAIVIPDPDLYHPYLQHAAAEFGVPLRFNQGELLAQSPAVSALMDLLNLPVLNYPRRQLLDVIRSPYFDLTGYALDRQRADILDVVSHYGQVIEGRVQWEEVFERLAQASAPAEVDTEEDQRIPSLPRGMQAQKLSLSLGSFLDRLTPPDLPRSLTEWVQWLEDLLEDWDYALHEPTERDQAAIAHFRETLRAMVLGEAIIALGPIDYPHFIAELQGAIKGAGYPVPIPTNQPAALVLRMIEARGLRFEAVAILGLSEGIFPVIERADPFLNEDLRLSLGLESRLQREQAGVFYQAVTRANRFVLLTRPYLAEDGEKWEPSPYWKAVTDLLPDHSARMIRPDDPRPLNDAASTEEALFWAVRRGSLPQVFAGLQPRWEYLRHAREILRARQAELPTGPYEGLPEALAESMNIKYGDQHVWSASRLETYGTCPYQFFVSSILNLETKAPPQLGLDAAQLGSVLHRILERSYAAAANPADPAAVLAVLPEVARQEFGDAPQVIGFRPSLLWETEQAQFLHALENTITHLAAQDAGAGWAPIAYEQPFGLRGVQPLLLQSGGQTIRLHGFVDRIDRDQTGRLRIIDYKTGSSHLAKQDLIDGRRLQLPLYALAAQETLGLGEIAEGLYWMVLKADAGSLKLSKFKHGSGYGPQAAITVALDHLDRIISGIRQAHFPPIPPKGGCPSYCPCSAWCWRYRPGWGA